MKFFAYLKKLNKLGASMVEYAIVLACISAFGASFSDNLTNVLEKPFNSIATILGLESGGSQTQQSAKDKAYDLFANKMNGVALDKSIYNEKNLLGSLAKAIASGGSASLEKILNNFGIDTLHSFESMISKTAELQAMGLIPQDAEANSAKILTIANENGLDKSHTDSFSATQYVFYKKGNNMYLAGTRYIDSVTNYKVGAETTSNGYTTSKKFSNATCTILGAKPEDNISFKAGDVNDKFVKYQP